MGADNDIYLAVFQFFKNVFLLSCGIETRKTGYLDRPVSKTVAKVLVMLLSQQGGWYQYGDLPAGTGDRKRSSPQNE